MTSSNLSTAAKLLDLSAGDHKTFLQLHIQTLREANDIHASLKPKTRGQRANFCSVHEMTAVFAILKKIYLY